MRPQKSALFGRQAEHEVFGEALGIALDLLVEAFDGDPVEFGEVAVQKDLAASKEKDPALQRTPNHRTLFDHVTQFLPTTDWPWV